MNLFELCFVINKHYNMTLSPFHALEDQDDKLVELGNAVDRLKKISWDINGELKSQNVMLGDLENGVGDANSKIYTVNNKLDFVLRKIGASKSECGVIVVLVCVVILLLFLVVFI